jgi:Lrp/AsnC family transcriptional regulator for asnA, asnC and gidA
MSNELDEIDREILKELQDDARQALRKIAEKLGVSESTVFFRVKKLQERGVIKRFTTIISPDVVGKSFTAFVLLKVNPPNYPAVLETLKKNDDIYEIFDVTGNYYTILKIRTRNKEELATVIDKFGLIDGITSTETAIVLRNIKEEMRINF